MPRLSWISTIFLSFFPLLAHDMWIEPAAFTPRAGEIVPVKLLVGQGLLGDPLPRTESLIRQFTVQDAAGVKPLVGREGGNPAGYLRVQQPGMMVVGYFSNPSTVNESAEKFNSYLREEGLESRIPASSKPVREMFARCAKSLLLSGSPSPAEGDRQLGFTLELTAEKNPYLLRAGEDLPVRLTYQSKPLAGALVVALNRLNPMDKVSARTGPDGRVALRLKPGGMWMIKAVHMIPAPARSNADWQSYWASLTFEQAGARL